MTVQVFDNWGLFKRVQPGSMVTWWMLSEGSQVQAVQVSNMSTPTVAYALLKTLRNYGIDTIFGIPGTHNIELYRALPELGIHPVTTRHEQGAGYAADGWSLQRGLPGVVITTSGPGLLNALSAVATAYAESRPMIVLTPGPPLGEEFADIGALHETKDTHAAAAAVAEWARRVRSGTEAVAAVHEAFELFYTGRPRPVVIEVPLDILEGPSDVSDELLQARPKPAPQQPDEEVLAQAKQLLAQAQHPVLLLGGGSLGAGDSLTRLAEQLDAPVVTSLNGRGAIPESHPLSLGASLRLPAAHELLNTADLVVVIGSKVGEAELWGGEIAPTGDVIRIDRIESQLHKNVAATVAIQADAEAVVPLLLEVLESGADTTGREDGRARAAAVRAELDAQGRAWHPPIVQCAETIATALPDNVVLAGDSSQICYYGTANYIPLQQPNSYLYMATYATLGYGLPAAIGAQVADPSRPVVCVAGDGALMFSIQELTTAVEQDLDVVVVCIENGGYREIEENEAAVGIPPIGVRLTQPDWAGLGTAFGGTGHRIASVDELAPTLRQTLEVGGVHVIHVPFDLFTANA